MWCGRRRFLPLRVFKNDIRRQYAQMYVNVLNSCDDRMINSFFETYASSCARLDKHCPSISPLYSSNCITIQGIPQLALFWKTVVKIVPDSVCSVEEVRIITSSASDECFIVCTFHSSFTNCYLMSALTVAMHVVNNYDWGNERSNIPMSQKNFRSTARPSPSTLLHDVDINKLSHLIPRGTLDRCEPQRMLVISTLSLHIDAKKRIQHFHYGPPAFAF